MVLKSVNHKKCTGTMFSKTLRKLMEARYFLDQMEAMCHDQEKIEYNFSAFISAARSVLWIMRSEFAAIPGWESWFDSKSPGPDEAKFLKSITKLRNRDQKAEPVSPGLRVELAIPAQYVTEEFKGRLLKDTQVELRLVPDDVEVAKFTQEGHPQVQARLERVFFVVDEFPENDILDIARKYYALLENLVSECNQHFGSNVS